METNIERSWIWVEYISRSNIKYYNYISLAIGTLILIIYFIFMVHAIEYIAKPYVIRFVSLGLSITIQLIGIRYFINYKKSLNNFGDLLNVLKLIYKNREHYLSVVVLVFTIFIMTDLYYLNLRDIEILYSDRLFNIYNFTIIYLDLFLLSTNVWIMLNMSRALHKIGRCPDGISKNMDLFNLDGICGLGKILDFIKYFLFYYVICISINIFIFTYPLFVFDIRYTINFMILLLLAGIFLFIEIKSLKKILRYKLDCEMEEINNKYDYIRLRLSDDESLESYNKNEQLACVSALQNIFFNEWRNIMNIDKNLNYLNVFVPFVLEILIPTLIRFLSSKAFLDVLDNFTH